MGTALQAIQGVDKAFPPYICLLFSSLSTIHFSLVFKPLCHTFVPCCQAFVPYISFLFSSLCAIHLSLVFKPLCHTFLSYFKPLCHTFVRCFQAFVPYISLLFSSLSTIQFVSFSGHFTIHFLFFQAFLP